MAFHLKENFITFRDIVENRKVTLHESKRIVTEVVSSIQYRDLLSLILTEAFRFLIHRALFDALDIPLVGGSVESRYLSMDKLITRGVLVSCGNVSCPDGFIYHKGRSDTLVRENNIFRPLFELLTKLTNKLHQIETNKPLSKRSDL